MTSHGSGGVGLHESYNAYTQDKTCHCGKHLRYLIAAKDLATQTEIIVQSHPTATDTDRLVVTFDGGGRRRKGSRYDNITTTFGAGCAVFVYRKGKPACIAQYPVFCNTETEQQAEAAGDIISRRTMTTTLRLANNLGYTPTEPHVLGGGLRKYHRVLPRHKPHQIDRVAEVVAGKSGIHGGVYIPGTANAHPTCQQQSGRQDGGYSS